ncbi:hypothetical protein PACTADRAFT_51804, partial [Pachysolen tannophilus NRRL Y-2460]
MSVSDYAITQLRSSVFYLLDNDLLQSAEFTCERLVAQNPSNLNSIYLYGLVLYKRQKFKTAYNVTANHLNVGCSYIFAKCSLELSLANEGIYALQSTMHLWNTNGSGIGSGGNTTTAIQNSEFERNSIPDAAACYCLLGKLYSSVNDVKNSAMNYSNALKLNPYIFEAFEELCKMGVKVRPNAVYKVKNSDDYSVNLFKTVSGNSSFDKSNNNNNNNNTADNGNGNNNNNNTPPPILLTPNLKSSSASNMKSFFSRPLSTPDHTVILSTPRLKQFQLPDAPTRKATRNTNKDNFIKPFDTINRRSSRLTASKVTSRLISQPLNNITGNNNMSQHQQALQSSSQTNQNTLKRGRNSGLNINNLSLQNIAKENLPGENYLMSLYLLFAKAFKAICKYDCFKAIRLFDLLPENEKNTPWVLGKLGRLHFEIVNYEKAESYFIRLRKLDRTRLEDMEYYSTLLWHLHKESELSYLSHELHEVDKNAPETWVAIGNSFSLLREPDEAIKCFEKAVQLNPNFAYAYTLQGHEYVSNDSFENALESFRSALLVDERHYNALYGIGMVYLKLGDFEKAEYHFRRAIDINPVNVILICCVGMVLEKLNKKDLALKQYTLAYKLQPLSALALFKRAQLLFSLRQYDEALLEFEKLQDLAPDEASVHFLLGQLYKLSGKKN